MLQPRLSFDCGVARASPRGLEVRQKKRCRDRKCARVGADAPELVRLRGLPSPHSSLKTVTDLSAVSSHKFNSQNVRSRVSNPRAPAYAHFKRPVESSSLPGAGPIFPG